MQCDTNLPGKKNFPYEIDIKCPAHRRQELLDIMNRIGEKHVAWRMQVFAYQIAVCRFAREKDLMFFKLTWRFE